MQIREIDQIGFFTVEKMCKDQGFDTFLISDGSLLVIPKEGARMTIDRPPEKLPTYSRRIIQKWLDDLKDCINDRVSKN